jgi:hypothetical protein
MYGGDHVSEIIAQAHAVLYAFGEILIKTPIEDLFLAVSFLALASVFSGVMVARAFKKHKR